MKDFRLITLRTTQYFHNAIDVVRFIESRPIECDWYDLQWNTPNGWYTLIEKRDTYIKSVTMELPRCFKKLIY